ncbi:MAG TPA: hypothetical protein VE422_30775 [Terriglobia bacterium]|nr:hypothetical protein [Terriglobia bacterium]
MSTVPDGVEVEIIDIDDLEDSGAAVKLSPEARLYAKNNGYL